MSTPKEIVILSTARTAFGSFQGGLSTIPAPKLGSIVIEAAFRRARIEAASISEVIMGNVLTAGEGQAPARQASIFAGIPKSSPSLTINKVCGSGMKAVMLGAQSIGMGDSEIVIAGGMENMSLAPYLSTTGRNGFRMGHQTLLDSMIHDGLWDPYYQQHMGLCAETCAKDRKISREEQDLFATNSFKKAQAAQSEGKFKSEIVPVPVQVKKGEFKDFLEDEGPAKAQFDRMASLKPAFDKAGTITAANASTINDGAAALLLASQEKADSYGLSAIARIKSYATFAQDPIAFTTAPIEAIRRAVAKAGWEMKEVDLFEVNEAFAVVAIAAQRELEIPEDKYNVWGGAIALGHPIGASGARILITLISALKDRGLSKGVAAVCIGGGEATAICVEIPTDY